MIGLGAERAVPGKRALLGLGALMATDYRHTQIGYLTIGLSGLALAALAISAVASSAPPASLVGLGILAVCLGLFSSLTAEVREGYVRCFFGFGLIRRTISLDQIVASSIVRNHWFFGWGIRWIPGGSLWNVSGLSAVELKLQSGKVFRIGTDDPEGLHHAIVSALASIRKGAR